MIFNGSVIKGDCSDVISIGNFLYCLNWIFIELLSIMDCGTIEELRLCSLMFPGGFYSFAKILDGKTPEEKKQIAGPHSEKVYSDFNSRFNMTDSRWDGLSLHLIVPNTVEEDWDTDLDAPEIQPGKRVYILYF